MWKFFLANASGKDVAVNSDKGEDRGLVVATRDHKTFTPKTIFFKNDTYGREMAQDGAYGSVRWVIHDGQDTTQADSGNCDGIGAETFKLKDTGQNFVSTVAEGMTVHNTTDGTYTWVTSVAGNDTLAVLDDIMDDGDDYIISPDWGFSEPVGTKWEESNTAQAHLGTKSLFCDNANVGDIMQLLNINGEGITLSHCTAITMWIRVESDWLAGDSLSMYGHNDGALIGNKVYLEDYFDYDNYGVWQYINIPLIDMGLTIETMDGLRFENESRAGAKSPKFWIDEIEFQISGAPIEFSIKPDQGTWFHVTTFQITFVDTLNTALTDGTMLALSYEIILDMTPYEGYIYQWYSGGASAPIYEERITSIMDLLSYPRSKITNYMCDSTTTLITVTQERPEKIVLKAEELDKMVIKLEDDFSQLLFFRVCVQGYVEQRK